MQTWDQMWKCVQYKTLYLVSTLMNAVISACCQIRSKSVSSASCSDLFWQFCDLALVSELCVWLWCVCSAGDVSGSAGDALEDSGALEENVESSPTPSSRRTRREACTCPYCKDGEGRYAAHHLTQTPASAHTTGQDTRAACSLASACCRGSVYTVYYSFSIVPALVIYISPSFMVIYMLVYKNYMLYKICFP